VLVRQLSKKKVFLVPVGCQDPRRGQSRVVEEKTGQKRGMTTSPLDRKKTILGNCTRDRYTAGSNGGKHFYDREARLFSELSKEHVDPKRKRGGGEGPRRFGPKQVQEGPDK